MKYKALLISIFIFFKVSVPLYSQNDELKLNVDPGASEIYNHLGYSVSMSGTYIIMGAYGDNVSGENSGSAWIYYYWGGQRAELTPDDGEVDDYFGHSVSISGSDAIVGADGDDDNGFESGSAYIFSDNLNWGQRKKLTASDGADYDRFGSSVAMSGDYAIVGAYGDDDNGVESGSAYIYYRNQGGTNNWGQLKKLTAADTGAYHYFGRSVSISGDYAVVGADGDGTGSAYIFYRNQGGTNNWGQVKKILPHDGAAWDYFGYAVSISGDYALVGAYGDDDYELESGSAYVYYRNQGGINNWGEVTKLTAADLTSWDYFGFSVSISGDDAVVGAYRDQTHIGSAYIFSRNQGGIDNWGLMKKITVSEGVIDDEFGYSVSISEDYAVIGAHGDDDNGDWSGSAYVFSRDQGGGNNWGLLVKLSASDGDLFGYSVCLSDDIALVGAYGDDDKGEESGSAYVFYRNQGDPDSWGQVAKLTAGDGGANDRFGYSVSLSGDYALVGADLDDNTVGSAYIFYRHQGGMDRWGEVVKLVASDRAWQDNFGKSVSLSGDYAIIGAYGDDDAGEMSGSAYLYYRHQGGEDQWGQLLKLTASDGEQYDFFGHSVSINGDYAVVGAYGADDDGDQSGSAYIYYRNQGGTNNWGQVKKINASDGAAQDIFGYSVSIHGDYAIVSSKNNNETGAGAVYIFYRHQGGTDNWGQQTKITASDGEIYDYFGEFVSINNNYILVGASGDDDDGDQSGSAYIFYRNEGGTNNWGELVKLTASDGATDARFGYSVSISGVHALIGAPYDDDFASNFGSAYLFKNEHIFVRSPNGGEKWRQGTANTITWESNIPGNVTINLNKGGAFNRTIALATENDGNFSWLIPEDINDGTDYTVGVVDEGDGNPYDESDEAFILDATPPGTPGNIAETNGIISDTWQNGINNPTFTWSAPTDLSGIDKYYLYFGPNSDGNVATDSTSDTFRSFSAPEGISFLRIRSKDKAGNMGNWSTVFIFKYDNTPPLNPTSIVETGGSATDEWQSSVSDPNFTWSGSQDQHSGIAKYWIYWGQNVNGIPSIESPVPSYDPPLSLNGVYYLRLSVEDAAGNRSPNITSFIFKHDAIPPLNPTEFTDLVGSQNDTWQNNVNDPNFTWNPGSDNLSGIRGYLYYWGINPNGTSPDMVYSPGFNPASVDTGTWYLRVSTVDNVNNSAAWITAYIFRFDNILPEASAASNDTSGYIFFTVNWLNGVDKGGSGLAGYNVNVKDGTGGWTTWLEGTLNTSEVYSNGEQRHTYYFEVAAIDNAGNMEEFTGIAESSTVVDTLTTDIEPPSSPLSLTAGGDSPSPWQNSNYFALSWTNPEDPNGIAQGYYKLDSAPTSNSDFTGVVAGSPPQAMVSCTKEGGQNLYLWLEDGRGNKYYLNNTMVELRYDGTNPGNTIASSEDTVVVLTFTVNWSGATDTGGSGLSGRYDVNVCDNGGEWTVWLADTICTSAEFTGQLGHSYDFEARAIDNAGNKETFSGTVESSTFIAAKLTVSLNAIYGEQSDSIRFDYSIYNYGLNATDLYCEYSTVPDMSWNPGTIVGNITGIPSQDYDGTLIWNSYADLPGVDLYTVRFKITPSDFGGNGLSDSTETFHLDNNRVPAVNIDPLAGEQFNTVQITYHLADIEFDTLSIICEYYHPGSRSWLIANTTGNLTDIIEYDAYIQWNSAVDLPLGSGDYQFRIKPYDNDPGISDTTSIFLNNVGAPKILSMSEISGEQSGDISFNYLLSDNEGDNINLICEYSDDSGSNWNLASVSGAVTNIPPAGYSGSVTWHSGTDLSGIDKTTVRFRISPHDGHFGFPKATNDFHLDNNLVPTVQISTLNSPLTGRISIPISILDSEGDTISITGNYKLGSGNWELLDLSGKSQFSYAEYNSTLVWNSLEDLGFGQHKSVQLQLYPVDNDTGAYALSNIFDTYNYAGDYSGDIAIDSDDLVDFALAWKDQDLTKEIGPAKGQPPLLIPQPDGTIDFEDLMVLVQQWNWSFDQSGTSKITATDQDYAVNAKEILPIHISTISKKNKKIEYLAQHKINSPDTIKIWEAYNAHLVTCEQSEYDQWDQQFADDLFFRLDTTAKILSIQIELSYDKEVFTFSDIENHLLEEQNGFTLKRDNEEHGRMVLHSLVLKKEEVPLDFNDIFFHFKINVNHETQSPLQYSWRIHDHIGQLMTQGTAVLELTAHFNTPQDFALYQNFPNPFNPATTIRYELPTSGKVQLELYNTLGQRVSTLVNKKQPPGYYTHVLDIRENAKTMASGLYFIRLNVSAVDGGNYLQSKKIILLK